MKKKTALLSLLLVVGVGVGVGAGAVTYALSPTIHEGKMGEAPELGRPGNFQIGTSVTDYSLTDRLSLTAWGAVSGNMQEENRNLSVRFWYPAETDNGIEPVAYSHVMKPIGQELVEITYQGRAGTNAKPLADQKFPLIIMSHGFGGWNTQFSNLGEHLASRGYVVASIEHADQPVESVSSFLLSFGNVLISRMLDQRQILEAILKQAGTSESGPLSQIDPEQVGLIGYSMGGYGAISTMGAPYSFEADPMANIPDQAKLAMEEMQTTPSAVDAFVTIAPWGGQPENRVWMADGLAKIDKPLLIISGSQDDVVNHQEGVKWLFDNLKNTDRHMLVFREARHNIAGNDFEIPEDSPFQISEFLKEPVWRTERINAINQHFITAFFDWRLKGEESKAAFLNTPTTDSNEANWDIGVGEQLNGKLAGDDEADYWRGFQRRWMTGLELHRADAKTMAANE